MTGLLLAGAESLFLDKLHLVVRHPLAYVAFIILVLAWVWRAYFLRTRKHLERLDQLPDADKLTALQTLVLGFPKTLTKNRLKVFQWRYMLVAFLATLAFIIILAGLAVHYWSLPESEIERRLGRIEVAIELQLAAMDAVAAELQAELDQEKQRNSRLAGGVGGVRVAADWARSLADSNPAVVELAKTLGELIHEFETEFSAEELSEVDDLRFRLARATQANAERRFQVTLELVTADDAKTEREATEAQIDREVKTNQVRGDAFYGLRAFQQALACYERLLQLRPKRYSTRFALGACLCSAGRLDEALEQSNALVHHYARLVEQEGRAEFANVLAACLINRGVALGKQGKLDDAIRDHQKAIEIWTRLVQEEGRAELADVLAGCLNNRGVALGKQRKLDDAIRDYQKAIEIHTRLVEQEGRTELANDLAMSLTNRGNALLMQGRTDDAIRDHQKAIEIRTQLVEQEGRTDLANDLAASLTSRAAALGDQGKLDDALRDYQKAIDICTRLVEQEGRTELASDLAGSLYSRGIALGEQGKPDDAIRDHQKAIEIRTQLVEQEGRTELANDLAASLTGRGDALLMQGKMDDAIRDYQKAIEIRTRLVEHEGRTEFANKLAQSLNNRGIALGKQGKLDDAIHDFQKAIRICTHLIEQEGKTELASDLTAFQQNLRLAQQRQGRP